MIMNGILINDLNRRIDISCVKQNHTIEEIDHMIAAAKKYQFLCTFALPGFTSYVIDHLKEEPSVMVGGTVGFPAGCETIRSKQYQADELLQLGCDELDMVINISALKSGKDNDVYRDIKAIVNIAKNKPVKAILEVTLLTEEEIVRACKIAAQAGVRYVKTGTGWCAKPTTARHIKLIKETVKHQVKIKAAGGIRSLNQIIEMTEAGCDRFGIGTNAAIQIMEEVRKGML